MKPIIIDMKNMSDSTEVYESRPNPFIIYFVYILAAMFIIALLWMGLSKIDIVVKSNGMFKSDVSPVEISSNVSGKVSMCNVKDGQYVDKGDILYTLEVASLDDTINYYQAELGRVNERIEILQVYSKILDGSSENFDMLQDNTYYQEMINRKKLLDSNIEVYATDDSDVKDIYILTEKNEVANEILTYISKKEEYDNLLKSYNFQNDNCVIEADSSGYFYLQQDIKKGSFIQEGTTIGKIYPKEDTKFVAQIYVENSDIGNLKVGQSVQFEIAAYPSDEYGYFTGKITNIPKDITVDQVTGSAYYVVEVSCDNDTIKSEDGESASLINGMACQAKIVVKEENVLKYLLRKIDLVD